MSGAGAPDCPPGAGDALREGLRRHFTPEQLARLGRARVGIAGAGGLGSNAALMLARSGVEDFLLIDHDVVERPTKVEALAELLRELNPHIRLELAPLRLDAATLPGLLPSCPIWVEAVDAPETKTLLVERALLAGLRVASASGMAGVGGPPMGRRRLGNLTLVGDFQSDVANAPPLAPRVTQAAALLADAALEFIFA